MVLRRGGYTVGSQLLRRSVSSWVPVALIDFYKVVRERERENEGRGEFLFTPYLKGKFDGICTLSRPFSTEGVDLKHIVSMYICTSMYSRA